MELEFHQLELRYERLRVVRPACEKRLLASLADAGQQVPILVVADAAPARYVVIDGYKRVRSLKKLARDVVQAARLDLEECEALVMSRLMRAGEGETALEQAWLLDELVTRFELSQERLARRFERSVSWVSRRLALVRELPDSVQELVRRGEIVAHAAVKCLVPLARAKRSDCELLASAIAAARLKSRDVELLYCAWRDGSAKTREKVITEPLLMLKALKAAKADSEPREKSPADRLLGDLEFISQAARRADRQLREGVAAKLLAEDREEMRRAFEQSRVEVMRLGRRLEKEMTDAGPRSTHGDSRTSPQEGVDSGDLAGDEGVAQGGEEGLAVGLGGGASHPQG
jgi:ParB family chromosome partitioning protein